MSANPERSEPRDERDLRFRRSPYLLIEFQGGRPILLHCDTLRRFRVDHRLIDLLSGLQEWTRLEDIHDVDGVNSHHLLQLAELGVLEVSRNEKEDADGPPRYWNPFDLVVQRVQSFGGYREDAVIDRGDPPPPAFKLGPPGDSTTLPPPLSLPGPLGHVLGSRRSIRTFGERPLRLEELSSVLYHSARIQSVERFPVLGEHSFRPFPSGGARSELEIYVVADEVEGLSPAAYYYDARAHELIHLRPKDGEFNRIRHWVETATGGAINRLPQAVLLITAVFERIMWKYQGIGLAVIMRNVGALYQTLYLSATALGLAPCALGGGPESANAMWLGLDPLVESQVGAFLLGTRNDGKSRSATPKQVTHRANAFGLIDGYQIAAVVRAASELRIHRHLLAGISTPEEIAMAEGANAGYLVVLMDALCALGLLVQEHGVYRMPGESPSSPAKLAKLAEQAALFADTQSWSTWGRLSDSVRTGRPVESPAERERSWVRLAEKGFESALASGEQAAGMLGIRAGDGLRILDLGCGSGAFGFAVLKADPQAELTCLDKEEVLGVTRLHASRLGIDREVAFRPQDLNVSQDFGEEQFDLVIASNLLHFFEPAKASAIVHGVARALVPGGRALIREPISDKEGRGRIHPLMTALWLQLVADQGHVFTFSELCQLIRHSGLQIVGRGSGIDLSMSLLAAKPR